MHAIVVEPCRRKLEALFATVGLPECRLLVVESVPAWGAAHGTAVARCRGPGLAATDPAGVPLVVLPRELTPEVQSGVTGAIALRGFDDETPRLADADAWLQHLALHQVAHHLLATADELACDRWAFEHLPRRPGSGAPAPRRMVVTVLGGLGVAAGVAAYGASIWQCYRHSGLRWALLVAVLPGLAQAFWWGVTVHDAGFFSPYSYVFLVAVLGLGLAGLLGGGEGASRGGSGADARP